MPAQWSAPNAYYVPVFERGKRRQMAEHPPAMDRHHPIEHKNAVQRLPNVLYLSARRHRCGSEGCQRQAGGQTVRHGTGT